MENSRLEKKIREWAISLGFRLPDGSAPPADFFTSLTVTPHRRRLWETLMEAVHPRQKVEMMRKQIFIAKLKERKTHLSRFDSKQVTDRIDLWYKQNALVSEIDEKKKAIIKMDRTIMEKASGLLFEIYKVMELENQMKELSEKSMVLKLLAKSKNKIVEDLNSDLLRAKALFCDKSDIENLKSIQNELFGLNKCNCLQGDSQGCNLLDKIKKFSESGVTEQQLWEEVIRWKKALLSDFLLSVSEFNSSGRKALSEKRIRAEMILRQSTIQLKQRIAEKSLQTIINSTEGKQLDLEIEKLQEKIFDRISCNDFCEDDLLNISEKMNVSSEEMTLVMEKIENYSNFLGVKSYQEFLKEKVKKLEEEVIEKKRRNELKNSEDGEEKLQHDVKEFERIVDEINRLKSEGKSVTEEIIRHQKNLESAFLSQKEEMKEKRKARPLQDVADKLKVAAEKQVDLILETPLGAFRTVKTSSERILFECESTSHCLKTSVGELKHFLSTMLIPPADDLQEILSEIDKRNKSLNRIKTFISERERLAARQRKIRDEITSIRHDSQMSERNFKESERILWSVSCKGEELLQDMNFVEKILKNWTEQPYRFMIRDTVEGKSLREYEERYRKSANK